MSNITTILLLIVVGFCLGVITFTVIDNLFIRMPEGFYLSDTPRSSIMSYSSGEDQDDGDTEPSISSANVSINNGQSFSVISLDEKDVTKGTLKVTETTEEDENPFSDSMAIMTPASMGSVYSNDGDLISTIVCQPLRQNYVEGLRWLRPQIQLIPLKLRRYWTRPRRTNDMNVGYPYNTKHKSSILSPPPRPRFFGYQPSQPRPSLTHQSAFQSFNGALLRRQEKLDASQLFGTVLESFRSIPLPLCPVRHRLTPKFIHSRSPAAFAQHKQGIIGTQCFSWAIPESRPPVALFKVPQESRLLIRDILQDYTGKSIPMPYFIVLVDATLPPGYVAMNQREQIKTSGTSARNKRMVFPRFSGALLTVLSYNRTGQNGSIVRHTSSGTKTQKKRSTLSRQMFDGKSVLIPDNYSPWTTVAGLRGYGLRKQDHMSLTERAQETMVREARESAASHTHSPTMAVLHKSQRSHIYAGWLMILEPTLKSPLRQHDVKVLRQNAMNFETSAAQYKDGPYALFYQDVKDDVQDCWETEIQILWDCPRQPYVVTRVIE